MNKYAVVKKKYDIYDEGILCIFNSSAHRRSMEWIAQVEAARRRNLKMLDVEIEIIKAAKAYKLQKSGVDILDYRIKTTCDGIRRWYMKTYPSDEAGMCIPGGLTFDLIYEKLKAGIGWNFYNLLEYASDSVIRDSIFQHLAKLKNCTYKDILRLWLSGNIERRMNYEADKTNAGKASYD